MRWKAYFLSSKNADAIINLVHSQENRLIDRSREMALSQNDPILTAVIVSELESMRDRLSEKNEAMKEELDECKVKLRNRGA